MPRLEIDSLSHRFEQTLALDDLSLEVAACEIVCLLGPSGCGKTTLLRLIAGLERLQVGSIAIGGESVARGGSDPQWPPERRNTGLMFQDYALFPHLTVEGNIAFGLKGVDRRKEREWIEGALGELQLSHLRSRWPHTLSGGQQQRIALLRALAPKPQVMLLDEPFSGLDGHLRQRVREETRAILKGCDAATLMVTHDPEEAMFLADRIVVLHRGRVMQDAAPADIYTAPSNPFTARLFGTVNELEGEVQGGRAITALGSLFAPKMQDGQRVLCLVRAEAIEIAEDAADAEGFVFAKVESARFLGTATHISLRLQPKSAQSSAPCSDSKGLRIESRLPGLISLPAGKAVGVRVSGDRAFVFAADDWDKADLGVSTKR
ncbi:ABC transporter ATP-binding protein [Thioalkalivibrio sp. HK1]|uniref:ABC transporter ATP-binding protein n=1 Tax=Thioalkalivibrio sp. HK1 TaxID=1469245 RepID=UPI000471A4D9|nr:ABC transporter ATP-binding protein [Thioalkalivibrio sp. HK1]